MLDEMNKLYIIYIDMQYENPLIVFFIWCYLNPYDWQLTEFLSFSSSIINFLFFKVELTACDQFYVVFGLAVMFFNSWQVQKWAKYLNSLCWLLRLQIGAAWRLWWGNRFEKLLSTKKNYVTSNYHRMGDLNFLKNTNLFYNWKKTW